MTEALAQPTRARLFRLLSELDRPAGTAELADRLGLHPNGIRTHLARLETAGLVVRARAPQARGRPRDSWTVSANSQPGAEPPTAFRDLARWLARTIPDRPGRLREVEGAGYEVGRELSRPGRAGAGGTVYTTLAALGFQPHLDRPSTTRTMYCLGNCPYRDAVKVNQAVVCTLHRGITRGLLANIEPHAELVDFVPRDPETAGCLIEVMAPPASRAAMR